MTRDLIVVGAWAAFDHLFRMDHYPSEGETVLLNMDSERAETVYFGDCSANIAVIASNLNISTGLVTVAGYDFETSGYKAYLKELDIDLSGTVVLNDVPCGHNYIFFDGQGDGFCFSHQGAAARQSADMISPETFQGAKHVVISEKFSDFTLKALVVAKQQGATTYVSGMIAESNELLERFLLLTDVLFINKSEFKRLVTRLGDRRRLFSEFGLKYVFITCGKRGAKMLDANGIESLIRICDVDEVVDTTGAGDAFVAGTVSAMIRGYNPLQAAEYGTVTSSFIIQKWGCQTNAPTWEQVEERYGVYKKQGEGDCNESY